MTAPKLAIVRTPGHHTRRGHRTIWVRGHVEVRKVADAIAPAPDTDEHEDDQMPAPAKPMNVAPMPAGARLVMRLARKMTEKARAQLEEAGQMGLFGGGTASGPAQVRGHIRKTKTGMSMVKPHLRHIERRSRPAPTPEPPKPTRAEQLADARKAWQELQDAEDAAMEGAYRSGSTSDSDRARQSAAIAAFDAFPRDIQQEVINAPKEADPDHFAALLEKQRAAKASDLEDMHTSERQIRQWRTEAEEARDNAALFGSAPETLEGWDTWIGELDAAARRRAAPKVDGAELWRFYKENEGTKIGTEARRVFLREVPSHERRAIIKAHEEEADRKAYEGEFASPVELSLEDGIQAYSGISQSPERRATQDRIEYADMLNRFAARARAGGDVSGLEEDLAAAKAEFTRAYRAMWAAKGRSTSWHVTGRSGRNERREQKKQDTADRRTREMLEVLPKWEKRIERKAAASKVEDAGGPVAAAEAKLAEAERTHDAMKRANKVIRSKKPHASKIGALVEIGFSEKRARDLLKPDFMGRLGFPKYALDNSRGRIKGAREKVAREKLRAARSELETAEHGFTGSDAFPHPGTVRYDYDADRVYLSFDDRIPKEKFRAIQRTTGFTWNRRENAFSHKMGDQALLTARRITGADLPPLSRPDTGTLTKAVPLSRLRLLELP